MIKKIIVAVLLMGILALALPVVQAQDVLIPGTCANVDANSDLIRIGVPEGAVANGTVGCRVIHNGENFVLTPAVIGNLAVIQRGVLASVDVFGSAGGGSPTRFAQEMQVCLKGTGTFIFLDANFTPRVPSEMPAVTRNINNTNYTCTLISNAGITVLVNGPAAPEGTLSVSAPAAEGTPTAEGTPAPESPPAPSALRSDGTLVPLSGCRVTITATVRIREEANTTSPILGRLPYGQDFQATARTADSVWYRVVFQSSQGWVNALYIAPNAGCE